MQLAREQGDFLLVGLHTDDDVMERRGAHLPIMDLHERSLSVLACRYVNEVIIGESACPTQSSGIDTNGWRALCQHCAPSMRLAREVLLSRLTSTAFGLPVRGFPACTSAPLKSERVS